MVTQNLPAGVGLGIKLHESRVWGFPGKNGLQSTPQRETPDPEGGVGHRKVEEERGSSVGRMRLGKARQISGYAGPPFLRTSRPGS